MKLSLLIHLNEFMLKFCQIFLSNNFTFFILYYENNKCFQLLKIIQKLKVKFMFFTFFNQINSILCWYYDYFIFYF